MRKTMLVLAATVLAVGTLFTTAGAVSQVASRPPAPGSAAWQRLSQHLLVAGSKGLIAQLRQRQTKPLSPPPPLNNTAGSWYAGQGDFMVSGNNAKQVWTTFYVPKVNCSQSTYGTSGVDIIYIWAGLGAGVLEQTGVEIVCTQGNNTAAYSTWSYFCCSGNTIDYSPIVPAPGDEMSFTVCAPNVCNSSSGYYFGLEDVTTSTIWNREANCPTGLACDDSAAIGTMEVGNTGPASLGTQWDLAKYSWLGTNGNVGAVVNSDNGQGTFNAKSGAWTTFQWQMYDSHSNFMTTTGPLSSDGQHFTWTYDSCC